MKIIGNGTNSYIAEIPKDEMANIMGMFDSWNVSKTPGIRMPQIGEEVGISSLYALVNRAVNMRADVNRLGEIGATLTSLCDELSPFKA